MTKGKSYKEVVDGCGPAPVRFRIQKELAKAEHEPPAVVDDDADEDADAAEPAPPRKVEVAVTDKGTIVARRVVYGKKKLDGYKKFDSIEAAASGLDKNRPEEAAARKQLGQFVENGGKAPGPVENAQGDV